MLLFRSEEHIALWRDRAKPPASNTLSIDQAARLADVWYRNKLAPDWRRHTAEEAEKVFAELGLETEFWRLR